jgi:hypothetical protein
MRFLPTNVEEVDKVTVTTKPGLVEPIGADLPHAFNPFGSKDVRLWLIGTKRAAFSESKAELPAKRPGLLRQNPRDLVPM